MWGWSFGALGLMFGALGLMSRVGVCVVMSAVFTVADLGIGSEVSGLGQLGVGGLGFGVWVEGLGLGVGFRD